MFQGDDFTHTDLQLSDGLPGGGPNAEAVAITPQEITAIRGRLGMTYRELATAIGLEGRRALNTVYRWERGSKTPSPANVEALRHLGDEAAHPGHVAAHRTLPA